MYQWDTKGAVSLNDGLVLSQYDLIDFPMRNVTVSAKTGKVEKKYFFFLHRN